jgi:hypothetical protein
MAAIDRQANGKDGPIGAAAFIVAKALKRARVAWLTEQEEK